MRALIPRKHNSLALMLLSASSKDQPPSSQDSQPPTPSAESRAYFVFCFSSYQQLPILVFGPNTPTSFTIQVNVSFLSACSFPMFQLAYFICLLCIDLGNYSINSYDLQLLYVYRGSTYTFSPECLIDPAAFC